MLALLLLLLLLPTTALVLAALLLLAFRCGLRRCVARRMELAGLEVGAAGAEAAVVGETVLGHEARAARAARVRVTPALVQALLLSRIEESNLHVKRQRGRPAVGVMRRQPYFPTLPLRPHRTMRNQRVRHMNGAAVIRGDAPQTSVEVV